MPESNLISKKLQNGGDASGLGVVTRKTIPSLIFNVYVIIILGGMGGMYKTAEHVTMRREYFICFERPQEFKKATLYIN